jgi:hypothetical protein
MLLWFYGNCVQNKELFFYLLNVAMVFCELFTKQKLFLLNAAMVFWKLCAKQGIVLLLIKCCYGFLGTVYKTRMVLLLINCCYGFMGTVYKTINNNLFLLRIL